MTDDDSSEERTPSWWVYKGEPPVEHEAQDGGARQREPSPDMRRVPDPPPWRGPRAAQTRGRAFIPEKDQIELINAALFLRRPLLVCGNPGTGKTSLAYAVAEELGLGPVLRWSITSRSTVEEGLYKYDAIARLQDMKEADDRRRARDGLPAVPAVGDDSDVGDNASADAGSIQDYIKLGPLGTAFFPIKAADGKLFPRVLLIDEIDKGDIDLPNDLLHLFEEQRFEIAELARPRPRPGLPTDKGASTAETEAQGKSTDTNKAHRFHVRPSDYAHPATPPERKLLDVPADGWVECRQFPLVIMTSNGEREFPPAFMRRCLSLTFEPPSKDKLEKIVQAHFSVVGQAELLAAHAGEIAGMIHKFEERRATGGSGGPAPGTDHLLNAVYVVLQGRGVDMETIERICFPSDQDQSET